MKVLHRPRLVTPAVWRYLWRYFPTRRRKRCIVWASMVVVGVLICLSLVVGNNGSRMNVLHDANFQMRPHSTPSMSEYLDGETFCEYRKRIGALRDIWGIKIDKDKDGSSGFEQPIEDKNICIIPKLDPCDPQIMVYDTNPPKIKCPGEENWVYVKNGTFRISEAAIKKHAGILCEYTSILRHTDFSIEHGPSIKPMLDGAPITTDGFLASCVGFNGTLYTRPHLGVPNIPELQERAEKIPLSPTALGGHDILMLGFDSMSRMSWMRNLPRTRKYFLKDLGAIELEGQNVLGDGTTNNILPLLTGCLQQDLPSARQGEWGSVQVDGYPFIFKDLKKAGYITMWSEDWNTLATFQYRLNGFRDQPVDHYLRPYFIEAEKDDAVEKMDKRVHIGCIGSELKHVRFLNYFRDAYEMYGKKRKFMFGFHKKSSHEDNSNMKLVDEDLLAFLKEMKHSGYLDHTILILMADHGARFSQLRSLQQGKLEERLPYLGISLPSSFKSAYPDKVNNLINNRHRLTTLFDVHETIREVLNSSAKRPSSTRGRGISLFQPIPTTRHCADCGVEPHWCACLSWENVAEGDAIKTKAAESIVGYFNDLTEPHRDLCEHLTLKSISKIARYRPQKAVLQFKQSVDVHGSVADMSDIMDITYEHIQVTLTTTPGDGQFEVTVTHYIKTGEVKVRSEEISRTNKYGKAPACISKSFPHLRPYCYCKDQWWRNYMY